MPTTRASKPSRYQVIHQLSPLVVAIPNVIAGVIVLAHF
jgi:hypothetical protein